MFDVLLSLALSFTIAYLAIPAIITIAENKKLFDVPDERKIHQAHIPSLGGLAIFGGFSLASLICIQFASSSEFQYFFAAAIVVFFLGLKDDILIISPIKKFVGQVLAAALLIHKGGIQITSMHGFLGIHELPAMFSILLTYFTVIVIINSFNLIDGIDGLAATLGTITASLFGFYFLKSALPAYSILAFSLVGGLVAFLIFNYHPAKIFMGDSGSMIIGLVNAILVIKFINISQAPGAALPIEGAPAIGFIALFIPLMDTLRVFSIRIFKRRSPFNPDRNHIHHLMLDKGLSHNEITMILAAVNMMFVTVAYCCSKQIDCTILIAAAVVSFFAGISMLYYTRRPRLFVARTIIKEKDVSATTQRIVPLVKDIVLERKN
jgi:UDP-GlcNAc:undecaprenyl-phosphate/decaprenyl-phosphate GlcNAc-1-phosphate transferase